MCLNPLKITAKKDNNYFVFTSNVDGQFQKGGFSDSKIEECHGSIHHFQCTTPCCDKIWDADSITIKVDDTKFQALDPLPHCENCGVIARPNILMFGDWTWLASRTNSQGIRLTDWLNSIQNKNLRLTIIEIGAGNAVATVRMQSENIARHYNATLIRINPRDYQVPQGHISINEGAASGINKIYKLLR